MIKFRAWDKETNKYFEPTFQAYMGRIEDLTIALRGRLQKRTCRGMVDESVFPGRYVVEQFTGLTDVNGKEIYEGDILATSSMIYGENITDYLKVELREDYAGFYCGEKPLYACLGGWDADIKFSQTYSKIVGNVHENPELLEADK
ncbi:YopX family protein [Lactiplantibacillus plantarum]|uniref:YopX family protein n=2 Tax=Lactiplantibacillus plantarum TaxID=1590 RepID=UPI000978ABA7|nr:YopX family protein [Lactiplantibacillus plantarum]QSW67367.1 hypothetical protein J0X23_02600 [Lactiplantibacillus plantarum]VFI58524.1 hypothetical protein LAP9492_01264 [Lactiplantibacillus plantarum]VFI59018.1 hypothetical protein LAP9571_01264 [Lactiplantibacillus plantarum]